MTVYKKLLMAALLAGLVFLAVEALPDIRRYLRMRSM
jgi:hypothetical protein